jgi:hypothetical protein
MLALLACAADSEGAGVADFEAGAFDFQTLNALDECLEGALEAFFMPEGVDVPHDFEYPIYVPSYAELPTGYDIDLREPFVGMPVTVTDGGDGWFSIRGSVMEEVRLDEYKYGDCDVTMVVDADLLPADADTIDGQARIDVSDPRGDEDRCPVFASDPCQVTLDLHATRSE